MRLNVLVATLVVGLAVSASAQVLTPIGTGPGTAADLLSRASRMAAENQHRFAKQPAQPAGWQHGTPPGNTRGSAWR